MMTRKRRVFLAVRWAVKEAAYKALYPVVKPTWKELTFVRSGSKSLKPVLQYQPLNIEDAVRIGHLHASVSHDGEYVFATVLAEAK
ncbi:hypothetical protein EW146_g7515 [Bondarzewia mesenterica]|uniref:4'-phosphopantetheinyl transferase domain-containing protein n=1 Tax=Bondarzewia mesenterica TaxID=1095465 RepID=A0A4S4LR78_9AGAM|nr:hypothetical protein EW146_g7515 [Bondarzewia mesenterica]